MVFLGLFRGFNLQNFCNTKNIKVQTEYNIGNGRIDMWLENDNFIIAIEGKTETEDHDGQLKKYDDFLQKQNKDYLLFYLTKYGSEPKFEAPDTVQLIGFDDTILPFVQTILEIEDLPNNISFSVNDYTSALYIYLYNLDINWVYKLKIVNEITKSTDNYLKYENIARNYYRDIDKYKNSAVEDIANTFEKAKAFIERDFLHDLKYNLEDYLTKEGFLFSDDSSILVNNFEENIDTTIDINTILEKRKGRTASFKNDDIDFIREKSGINIIYINRTLENEYLRLTILNDIYGLNIYFNHVKNDECINYFENQHIELFSSDIFRSSNIEKLLDNEYRFKLIDTCKIKLLSGLKQIEV